MLTPKECFDLCYLSAWNGVGKTRSNPLVGAVLTDSSGKLIGASHHESYGGAHAERTLLEPLNQKYGKPFFSDKVLYISLEPCAHFGKTPPCSSLIKNLGISKVYFAQKDPHDLVSGKGILELKEASIICEHVLMPQIPFYRLTERFLKNITGRRPFIGLKIAKSSDGTIGVRGKSRFWLTGKTSGAYSHWLRQVYDAILVGSQTILNDNPELNVRHGRIVYPLLTRIILDGSSKLAQKTLLENISWNIFKDKSSPVIWILSDEKLACQLESLGVHTLLFKKSLEETLVALRTNFNITSILVEGGNHTWQQFMRQNLVDRYHIFTSPHNHSHLKDRLTFDESCLPKNPKELFQNFLDKDHLLEFI